MRQKCNEIIKCVYTSNRRSIIDSRSMSQSNVTFQIDFHNVLMIRSIYVVDRRKRQRFSIAFNFELYNVAHCLDRELRKVPIMKEVFNH